jgi:hypothetical protein
MWPFKRKPVVDAEAAAWHANNFAWLIRRLGGNDAFMETKLVLPKSGFFVFDGEQGHPLAVRIFDQVKNYCGMADWDVDLVPDDNPLAEPSPVSVAMIAPQKHALGTFAVAGNRIQISYVPALLQRPDRLIATFAHELAHYLLATVAESPPCEEDEIEFLTDLAAVYLGFGVFLANTRFDFEVLHDGPMQGWRMAHSGYLPEADLIFSLSLFLRAKSLHPDEVLDCLKPHLAAMLRRTMRSPRDDDPDIILIREALASGEASPPSGTR